MSTWEAIDRARACREFEEIDSEGLEDESKECAQDRGSWSKGVAERDRDQGSRSEGVAERDEDCEQGKHRLNAKECVEKCVYIIMICIVICLPVLMSRIFIY